MFFNECVKINVSFCQEFCCTVWINFVKILVETGVEWPFDMQGPYSPTRHKNAPILVLQIFLYLVVFECKTTSD